MPPNLRRYLPLIAFALILVIVLPGILKKKSTTGSAPSATAAGTIEAANLIDKGEQAYKTAHGHFTPHLADLLTPQLANDVAVGLTVRLDVGTDGQRYLAQVDSAVLDVVRGRNGAKVSAHSCVVLKSGSNVACPAPAK